MPEGRWERISGRVGKDPERLVGGDGKPFARFSLCVEDYDDGKVWYTVVGREEVAEFILRRLEKGTFVYCGGQVTARSYTSKDGQAKLDRKMKATQLTIPGGEEIVQAAKAEGPTVTPEAAEAARRKRVAEVLKVYPPRWGKAEWFTEERRERTLATRPDIWLEEFVVPDPDKDEDWEMLPNEIIGDFIDNLRGY